MQHIQLPTKQVIYGTVPAFDVTDITAVTPAIGTGVKLLTIVSNINMQVLLEPLVEITTVFNGTPVMVIGTTPGGSQILGATDISEAALGFNPIGNAGRIRFTGPAAVPPAPPQNVLTDIYVTITGAGVTLGAAKVYLRLAPLDNFLVQPQ